jgi:hypothetical protein
MGLKEKCLECGAMFAEVGELIYHSEVIGQCKGKPKLLPPTKPTET